MPSVESGPFCGIKVSTCKTELKDGKGKFRASLWENLSGLTHSMGFLGNFYKQRVKIMLDLSRNKPRIFLGLLRRSLMNKDGFQTKQRLLALRNGKAIIDERISRIQHHSYYNLFTLLD